MEVGWTPSTYRSTTRTKRYGALVPVAVLDAAGEELDDDMAQWEGLDDPDVSVLVSNPER